jgi:hypothetical protein
MSYNTVGFADNHFIKTSDLSGLEQYTCNVDATEIKLTFNSPYNKIIFVNTISQTDMFIIEGTLFGCDGSPNVRRYMSVSSQTENTVVIRAVPTRYDEIFQDADIHVDKIGKCSSDEVVEHVCIGINTVDCKNPYQEIPIYHNQYLSITCPSCFLGLGVDLFLDLKIHMWHLEYIAGGFKNIQVNGANIYSLYAHGSWSTGVDKTYTLVPPKTILDFHIGPIPIKIWFEIPLHVLADASFSATANARVGAIASWDIGNAYIKWDPVNHWTTVGPNPKFSWTPVISGSTDFKGTVNVGLIPSVNMHLDNLFDYTLTFSNTADLQVYGSGSIKPAEAQLCAKADGVVQISGEAELHINIPFVHLADKKFGPYVYFDKKLQIFPEKCVKV